MVCYAPDARLTIVSYVRSQSNMNQPATTVGRAPVSPSTDSGQLLHGPWLLIARVAWIALTLLVLALNFIMLPRFNTLLRTPCSPGIHCFYLNPTPFDQRLFRQSGLTLGFLANFQTAGNAAVILIYCVIAAIIFWRRSNDRMALFCAFTLVLFGGAAFTSTLQDTLAVQSGFGFWLFGILYVLGQTSLITFFFLFPNGHFVPRWSWLLALIVGGYWTYDYFSHLIYSESFDWSILLFFGSILAPVAAQIYRYRRVSTHWERQQTKWVVFGFVICMVGFVLFLTVGNLLLPPEVLASTVMSTFVAQTILAGFLLLIPISIAIAILRSRLYDIDVIINRTLVYGSLTAVLAGIDVAGVVCVQAIVNAFAQRHSSEPSPILIVITTLAVAALFQPLRRRLQRAIDRRFYRRKYNVEKTLASFSATLRQEVN